MKRGILLALLIAIIVTGLYSVKEWMPIMAIAGNSMEPELKSGDAILIEKILPSDVEVGDVIVFNVHPLIQESYRYPALVAHRVTELTTFQGELAFKTRGDNTADDPFVVPATDLRGEVRGQIPYLGYLLLFLQSRQGLIFIAIALPLFALYLYGSELSQGGRQLQKELFAPIIEENQHTSQVMEQRIGGTEQALGKFAEAIGDYAEHLKSHTSAIQGLSDASQELKRGTVEQNKVLASLSKVVEQMASKQQSVAISGRAPLRTEPAPPIEELTLLAENPKKRWATGLEHEDWLE